MIAVNSREVSTRTLALADNVITPVAEFTEVMVVPEGMPSPATAIPATSPAVDANSRVLTALVELSAFKFLVAATEFAGIEKVPEEPMVFDWSDSTNWFVLL